MQIRVLMDENKILCVNCLEEVDADTHKDCTLTFDNLLAAEERDDTGKFQQNGGEGTVQRQQVSEEDILQKGNEGQNLLKRKRDFNDPETLIQNLAKEIFDSRNSGISCVSGVNNPGVQGSENSENGNSTSRLNEDKRFHYDRAELYNPQTPLFPPSTHIGQITVQTPFGGIRPVNELQENIERNRFYQEQSQSSYGRKFVVNTLQPYCSPDFFTAFSYRTITPNTIGHMESQLQFIYPQSQNLGHGPQVSMINSNGNIRGKAFSVNLNNSPSGFEQMVNLKCATQDKTPMNIEVDLLAQNKLPWPLSVSKIEMPYVKKINSRQKNVEMGKQKRITKRSAHLNNEIRGILQNNTERNVHRKNQERRTLEEHVENKKDAEKRLQQNEKSVQKNMKRVQNKTEKNAQMNTKKEQKKTEKSVQLNTDNSKQKNTDNSKQKNTDTSIQNNTNNSKQKNTDNSTQKNTDNSLLNTAKNIQKNREKSIQYMDTKSVQNMETKGVQEKDVENNALEMDAEKSVQPKNSREWAQQEKARRFTGEGYKSIEEFIEALYNGTLYRRF